MSTREEDIIEAENLTAFFTEKGFHNIAALIEYLDSPAGEQIDYIHMSCLDKEPLREVAIGSPNREQTPLDWFAELKDGFDHLVPRTQTCIDKACKRLLEGTTKSDSDVYQNGRYYRIPAGVDMMHISEEELKAYEIPVEESALYGV